MARPIIEAIRNRDVSLAKKLLQTHKYNCLDCQTARRDGTALYWAANRGFAELVELLLKEGASVNAKTGFGASPLHAAADANQDNVIRLLLGHGADINSSTVNGDTPCHLAAYRGHNQAVQVLVEAGADLNLRNRKCHRPVDEAESNGHSKIVEYLSAVSNMFNCTNATTSEIEVCCNLPYQRVPLRDCNSSPVCPQENVVSPPKTHYYHYFHHNNGMTNNMEMAPRTENVYMSHYMTVNDLSMNTNSLPSNTQLMHFNIPLYD